MTLSRNVHLNDEKETQISELFHPDGNYKKILRRQSKIFDLRAQCWGSKLKRTSNSCLY